MNDNQFQGHIPVNSQHCNHLETISLHENLFNGLLPDFSYHNDTNITKLSLHNNKLQDDKLSQWLHALFTNNPYLEFLSIYGNDISGHLFHTSTPHLRTFQLVIVSLHVNFTHFKVSSFVHLYMFVI